MKKTMSILTAIVMSAALIGCGASPVASTQAQNTPSVPTVAEATVEPAPVGEPGVCQADGYTIKVIAVHKTKDSNGDPLAAVELSFTNDNADPISFMGVADVKVYQNGVEMWKSEMFLERDFDWDTYYTEIKDGATISVFRALPLQDEEHPVEVQIDLYNLMRSKTLASTSVTMDLVD